MEALPVIRQQSAASAIGDFSFPRAYFLEGQEDLSE
jgi:hypothetical protein